MSTSTRAGAAPRKRKLGKRQQERAARAFTDACLEAFRQLGAVPDPEHRLEPVGDLLLDLYFSNYFKIETRAGALRLAPSASWVSGVGGAVHCIFDEPARALALIGDTWALNRCSGKWHAYYFDEEDSAKIVESFVARVRPLLLSGTP